MAGPQGAGTVGGPPADTSVPTNAGEAYDQYIRRIPGGRSVSAQIAEELAAIDARIGDPKFKDKAEHYAKRRAAMLVLKGVQDGTVKRDQPV